MKYPLRSARISLTPTEGRDIRVDLDGLVKGYIVRALPGEGGGWFWRRTSNECGHVRGKEDAVRLVLDMWNWRPRR